MLIRNRKGQGSIEFVILFSAMMLIFLLFFIVIQNRMLEAQELENEFAVEEIAKSVMNEVRLAKSVSAGYVRVFSLPEEISGIGVEIEVMGDKDLVIRFEGKEYVFFLDDDVRGLLVQGKNSIERLETEVVLYNYALY